jgi:hypothetical protein
MQKDSVKKSLELLKVQGIFLLNLEVVPPGIVIYSQVVECHSFLKATQL